MRVGVLKAGLFAFVAWAVIFADWDKAIIWPATVQPASDTFEGVKHETLFLDGRTAQPRCYYLAGSESRGCLREIPAPKQIPLSAQQPPK